MKFNILVNSILESVENEKLPTIKVLYDYVKDKPVHDIPIKELIHELKPMDWETGEERPGTKEFIKRGNAADLKYPIIVFKSKSGKLLIMDGVHRLWKAKDAGDETIKGHILTQKEAEKFKWKDGKGVMVSFT